MRKMWMTVLASLLAVCLTAPCALADEEMAPLTVDEVDAFVDAMREKALSETDVKTVPAETEGEYQAAFSGGVLMLAADELKQDTAVLEIELAADQPDPRGVLANATQDGERVGVSVQDVMAQYPCANEELYGDYQSAVVALSGEVPGAAFAGVVERDGQHVQSLTYYAWEQENGATVRSGIRYRFSENELSGVTVLGRREVENAQTDWDALVALQEEDSYFAYPVSQFGEDLDPFVREDLTFSGLDFLSVTYDDMQERFGTPQTDSWLEDGQNGYLRSCAWEGMEAVFAYDGGKQFVNLQMLTATGAYLEGPRCIRVGDTQISVMYRFRHGMVAQVQNGTVLYGDGEKAPFGMITYGDGENTLTYAADCVDCDVYLYAHMTNMRMTDYILVRQEKN